MSVKNKIKALLQKWRYRHVYVGAHTLIRKDSILDKGCKVGAHSTLQGAICSSGCSIGAQVSLYKNCKLARSSLSHHVSCAPNTQVFNSTIEDHVAIQEGAHLTDTFIGHHSYVARETYLNNVELGSFCSIGPRCLIGSGEHPSTWLSTSPVFYSTLNQCVESFSDKNWLEERKRVHIGNDVWLGAMVFVRDGIRIGNGAVIAAGSIVVKDVPPYAIVGGAPAKLLRMRFSPETILQLQHLAWWNWSDETLQACSSLMRSEDPKPLFKWAVEHSPQATRERSSNS